MPIGVDKKGFKQWTYLNLHMASSKAILFLKMIWTAIEI